MGVDIGTGSPLASATNADFGTIFVSLDRAPATYNSADLARPSGTGICLYVNTTVVAVGGLLVVKVQGKDPVSGGYFDVPGAVTASIGAVSLAPLTVYPGLVAVTNVAASALVPPVWRVVATVSVANVTFSVGGSVLL